LKQWGNCSDSGDLDVDTLIDELGRQAKAVDGGDLAHAEEVLLAQARTLDFAFHTRARRAAANLGEFLSATETYLRLALKAQSQCRATLETLAAIKYPSSPVFARQANIAHGPLQVINAPQGAEAGPWRAGETQNPRTKVLERIDGERLDTRAAGASGGTHPPVETVGAQHWAEDGRR
jgi:hypothetical protein